MTVPKYKDGDWRKPVRTNVRTDITEKQERFLDWLTDPERSGSQEQLAATLDLHYTTLSKWKTEALFVKRWEQRLRSMNVSPERTQLLMDRTFKIAQDAKDADALKAIELYMKLVDRISPQRIAIEVERPLSEMSPEELAEAAMSLRGSVVEATARITTGAGILAELANDDYEDD